MKTTWRFSASTASALGYGLLILALTTLGMFVASLALGSGPTVGLGIGFLACMTGSVMGFRTAARELKRAEIHEPTSPVSIFSTPMSSDDVDRYVADHHAASAAAVPRRRTTSTDHDDTQSGSVRLSA